MKPNRHLETWKIGACIICSSPVLGVPDNESAGWPGRLDWVAFCANEKCENHKGEEMGDQDQPEWVIE